MKRNAKPSSGGSSSGRGSRLRLTLLLATAAAFLLVPAAQAFAAGNATVNIEGNGGGEVKSEEPFAGTPEPIVCSYTSPGPKTGVCENEMFEEEGLDFIYMTAYPAEGSAFTGWTVEEGTPYSPPYCEPSESGGGPSGEHCALITEGGNSELTATFALAFPLKLEKITTNGGEGTVVSSPGGILCGTSCTTQTAQIEKEKEVVLTASAAAGSVFTSWTGCSIKTEGRKCYVKMSQARTVKSKFTKVQPLTAVKDPTGTGTGTLSSSPAGISCAPSCTKATALFTEGAASFVTVKAVPLASTSEFDSWTKCPEVVEVVKCKVAMTAAQEVEAKFKAIPQNALKLTKNGGNPVLHTGTGTVTSSPAGISCGQNCSSAEASYLKTKSVTLKEVASKGSSFAGWGASCSGFAETCTVAMNEERTVFADFK